MKYFLLLALLISSLALAAEEKMLAQGVAHYTVNFVSKTVTGSSPEVKGKVVCQESCEFLLAIPIKSFDSGDSNRDLNMLTIMNASEHPVVTARGSVSRESWQKGEFTTEALISLNGVAATYPVKVSQQGERAHLDLILERHQLQRPSLFTVKIEKIIPMDFEFKWR